MVIVFFLIFFKLNEQIKFSNLKVKNIKIFLLKTSFKISKALFKSFFL